jgi:hypothetical protein
MSSSTVVKTERKGTSAQTGARANEGSPKVSKTVIVEAVEDPRSHRRQVLRAIAVRHPLEGTARRAVRVLSEPGERRGEVFLWSRLEEQAAVEQVTTEELIRHALAYYFADLDQGRVAARAVRELGESVIARASDPAPSEARDEAVLAA